MKDLRLVGVHDDGRHLLLSGAGGEMFRLPIDEALRVAASRTPAQVAARASAPPVAMSPRDIQARIRSGASAAEIAELSGLPLANVQRYEGPVLAEREYVAEQARKVEVAAPVPGHDAYRAAFGDHPATLGEMVSHRLTAHGIDSSTVEWDSWRRTDGSWTVVARFEPNPSAATFIGEEPPAMWTFSPARKSLHNANRWAQQLSELEPLDGPVPTRRLTAVSDRPFDVEAEASDTRPGPTSSAREADGLLDMLRSRRGQRLGVDENGDDALALLLTNGVPAAHPRPSEVPSGSDGSSSQNSHDDDQDNAAEISAEQLDPSVEGPETQGTESPEEPEQGTGDRRRDGRPSILSRLSLAPRHELDPRHDEGDSLRLHDGVSTDTREITVVPGPLRVVSPFAAGRPAKPRQESASGEGNSPAPQRAGLDELIGGSPRGDSRPRDASPRGESSRQGAGPIHAAGHREGSSGARPQEPEVGSTTQATPTSPVQYSTQGVNRAEGQRTGQGNGPADGPQRPGEENAVERQPSRPKRSSVPSWDEIVFGTRGD